MSLNLGHAEPCKYLMTNRKVLLADDNHANLQSFLQHFDDRDNEILYAPNGAIACEIAREEMPDIIIMDWAMPVMNGIEATLKIKATKDIKDIPIIIATGNVAKSGLGSSWDG